MSETKLSTVLPDNTIRIANYPRKPESTIYVENSNNLSSLEDVQYVNDIQMSFPGGAVNFGSLYSFRFPRTYQFLGACFIQFEIGCDAITSLSDYTAYSFIQEIKFTVGGTELLRVGGNSLVPLVLDQCETEEKKTRLLELAGMGGTDITDTTAGFSKRIISAFLPLPWSDIGAKCFDSIRPFPLHLLDEPVEMQLILRNESEVKVGTSLTIAAGRLCFQYAKIANPGMLKNSVYKYPFVSQFTHEYSLPVVGVTVAAQRSIDLLSFRKGELRELKVHLYDASTATTTIQTRYAGLAMNNIELLFNGQKIWSSLNGVDGMWDLIYNKNPTMFAKKKLVVKAPAGGGNQSLLCNREVLDADSSVSLKPNVVLATQRQYMLDIYPNLGDAANANTANSQLLRGYYYTIPLAEILSKYVKQGHVIGTDASKQALQLRFTSENLASTLVVTHCYSAMYHFDGSAAALVF